MRLCIRFWQCFYFSGPGEVHAFQRAPICFGPISAALETTPRLGAFARTARLSHPVGRKAFESLRPKVLCIPFSL